MLVLRAWVANLCPVPTSHLPTFFWMLVLDPFTLLATCLRYDWWHGLWVWLQLKSQKALAHSVHQNDVVHVGRSKVNGSSLIFSLPNCWLWTWSSKEWGLHSLYLVSGRLTLWVVFQWNTVERLPKWAHSLLCFLFTCVCICVCTLVTPLHSRSGSQDHCSLFCGLCWLFLPPAEWSWRCVCVQ